MTAGAAGGAAARRAGAAAGDPLGVVLGRAVLPAAWLAFLVPEPDPRWQAGDTPPRHARVTAGWALLGAVVVSGALSQLLPGALRHALLIR